jgi:hypothetical protein
MILAEQDDWQAADDKAMAAVSRMHTISSCADSSEHPGGPCNPSHAAGDGAYRRADGGRARIHGAEEKIALGRKEPEDGYQCQASE